MKLSCQEGLVPGTSFAERLKNLEKYGFEGIELNGGHLHTQEELAERRSALADSPIKASSICGGNSAELVHPDRSRRQKCSDGLKRQLEIAAEFGATGPITVPIFNHNDRVPDLSPWKTRAEIEKELLVEMLLPLAEFAVSAGSAVLLEPLNRNGHLYLNDHERHNPHMERLAEQFIALAPGSHAHDDGPDAVEGAIWIINQKTGKGVGNGIVAIAKPVNDKRF